LPGWFEQHRNLSKKEIQEKYFLCSGLDRSYDSLQAELYKQGCGYLCNKKNKASHGRHAATEILPPAVKLPVPGESTDPTQLSVALGIISRSLCPRQQISSGTQTMETAFEKASPWQEPQEGGSLPEKGDSSPEPVVEPDCQHLAVTRLGGCGYRPAVQEVPVYSKEKVHQRKEPLATVSPDLQSSVFQPIGCGSDNQCIDGSQDSWSGEKSHNCFQLRTTYHLDRRMALKTLLIYFWV
jgi:hypothetical protein